MRRVVRLLACASALAIAPAAFARPAPAQPALAPLADPSIPFTRTVLKNGLVLVVHVAERPLSERELALAQHNLTLSLPGSWETNQAVARSYASIAVYELPADYYATFAQHVAALSQGDVERAARTVVRPASLTWIVVGDRKVVTKPLESLGLKVVPIDADGAPLP